MTVHYIVKLVNDGPLAPASFDGNPLEAFKNAAAHAVIMAQLGFGPVALVNNMSGVVVVTVTAPEGN